MIPLLLIGIEVIGTWKLQGPSQLNMFVNFGVPELSKHFPRLKEMGSREP